MALDPEFVADCPYGPEAVPIDEIVEMYPDAWEVLDDWDITLTPAVRKSTVAELAAAQDIDLYEFLEDLRECAEDYEDEWDDD